MADYFCLLIIKRALVSVNDFELYFMNPINHGQMTFWIHSFFLPLAALIFVELKQNREVEQMFIFVSDFQTLPPDYSGMTQWTCEIKTSFD